MRKLAKVGARDVRAVIPKRSPESHKGDFGRLLVVGGGSRYVGAPALVGLAALRSGVDLSVIAAPERTAWVINSFSPDLITIKLPCADLETSVITDILGELDRSTGVVLGPGLSTSAKTSSAVVELAHRLRENYPGLPALFDAGALKPMASEHELMRGMPWVVTPHAGEFKDLMGSTVAPDLKERATEVELASQELGCVILLKGHVDIIASPEGDVSLNHTGNPGMTHGGTGDVLSGIVAAFLSQGAPTFRAAAAGAWVCGRAGDLCQRERGYEFVASDLIDKLPEIFMEVRGKG